MSFKLHIHIEILILHCDCGFAYYDNNNYNPLLPFCQTIVRQANSQTARTPDVIPAHVGPSNQTQVVFNALHAPEMMSAHVARDPTASHSVNVRLGFAFVLFKLFLVLLSKQRSIFTFRSSSSCNFLSHPLLFTPRPVYNFLIHPLLRFLYHLPPLFRYHPRLFLPRPL